jgi:formate dehydrogenase formation protein
VFLRVPHPAASTIVVSVDLREEWADLLERRPAFRETLGLCTDLIECWARWSPSIPMPAPLAASDCRRCWECGEPLLAAHPPSIAAEDLEDVLGLVVERLRDITPDAAPALHRFAEAWDRGVIGPAALFPAPGRIGTRAIEEASGLPSEFVAFLAGGSLRPVLDACFAPCREHLRDGDWRRGACPFCGAPPGFADVLEDGQRRLTCHLCGGGWSFARARCPFCGTERSADLARLEMEEQEQGYLVWGCKSCRGYIKELDRRVRWNGRSGLVEDWGSPHFDLVAMRSGYRRPIPSLIQLARGARGGG